LFWILINWYHDLYEGNTAGKSALEGIADRGLIIQGNLQKIEADK